MSESTPEPLSRPRRMSLVAEREVPDQVVSLPSPPTPQNQPRTLPPETRIELQARAAWRAGVIGSLNVATAILSVRLILLISVGGAIALAWAALAQPDPMRLGALGIYLAGAVLPVVWLSGKR